MRGAASAVAVAAIAACALRPVEVSTAPLVLPFQVDSQRAEVVAAGVVHRFIHSSTGPWAVHVLDVDRDACYSAVAVKGFAGAIGRKKTSAMLRELDSAGTVVGGVNADFFEPNGVPRNAHISRGRVISGPSDRPVLAFDSLGRPRILILSIVHFTGSDTLPYRWGWNRVLPQGISVLDSNWGAVTDTASRAIEAVYEPHADSLRLARVDTSPGGVAVPRGGRVLVLRGDAASDRHFHTLVRDRPRLMQADPALLPFHPLEAVGGRPMLARDSSVVAQVDTAGGPDFATRRHPRTAVGIARDAKRLLLVTVDGRQKPYSDGMTLRELANLMLALGARDAINLDGGGSTAMVVKAPATGTLALVNAPSDSAGERAVGNALAIVKGCTAAR